MTRELEKRDKKVIDNKDKVIELTSIFDTQSKELKGIMKRYG